MRMRPSQSSVMKPKVGSTSSLTTVEVEPVALGDPRPVMHAGAAQRIHAHANAGDADGIEIDHAAQVADVGVEKIVLARGGGAHAPARRDSAYAGQAVGQQRIGLFSIQPVTPVSAGPPFGGLYLKPPSSGGLCEGVMTMPSASPVARPRL